MDANLLALIAEIKSLDLSVIYTSFRNLFEHIRAPFCKFEITPGHKLLYRVRTHIDGDGNYLFKNIRETLLPRGYNNNTKVWKRVTSHCKVDFMLLMIKILPLLRFQNLLDLKIKSKLLTIQQVFGN